MNKKSAPNRKSSPRPSRAAALLCRIGSARDLAQVLEKDLKETAPLLDERSVQLFSHKVFDAAAKEKPDLKTLMGLISLLLKVRQQALAERRFELFQAMHPGEDPKGRARRRDGGYSKEQLQQIEEMINLL
jgi:hypothetical protein